MYPKYVTAQAEKNLINKLNLPNINSQDWEYEIADSFKLEGYHSTQGVEENGLQKMQINTMRNDLSNMELLEK